MSDWQVSGIKIYAKRTLSEAKSEARSEIHNTYTYLDKEQYGSWNKNEPRTKQDRIRKNDLVCIIYMGGLRVNNIDWFDKRVISTHIPEKYKLIIIEHSFYTENTLDTTNHFDILRRTLRL